MNHDYTLHQQTLEKVQSARYLDITITENMDWGQHISDISSKATKILGLLRRNLAFAPRSTKKAAAYWLFFNFYPEKVLLSKGCVQVLLYFRAQL